MIVKKNKEVFKTTMTAPKVSLFIKLSFSANILSVTLLKHFMKFIKLNSFTKVIYKKIKKQFFYEKEKLQGVVE